jgi:hypothetical protein
MNSKIQDIFNDKETILKIQNSLPKLFHIAELESSRAGKIGMEVGTIRERIIVAFLLYKFGSDNIETEIPTTETEMDVKVFGSPISIKTITGAVNGVKLIWTVDAAKAREFSATYNPGCDMIFIQINWRNGGGFYYIPKETQAKALETIGRNEYIKLPKEGTNPRGVEMTGKAVLYLLSQPETLKITINWHKEAIEYKPFKRWIELWEQE